MSSAKRSSIPSTPISGPARIESLKVCNYRALRSVEFKDLTPLTVLVGANGSGKSTVFDVLYFLAEAFQSGLRSAWDHRGRAKELRTRGESGPVSIEIKYRERPKAPLMTYHLAIDDEGGKPIVVNEWLSWTRGAGSGRPFHFLKFARGKGMAIRGDAQDETGTRTATNLRSPDVLAVSTLGQFAEHPRVAALREFIVDWYVSYLSIDDARKPPEAGPQERLSKTGDNVANVVQYLKEQHPRALEGMFVKLRQRIPQIEKVTAEPMPDGRLLLQIKDAPFVQPMLARFASDGTLKLLAYLIVLHDPNPPQFIGIEEPENFLHPRLLAGLVEECREASAKSQLLATTHSPFFLNGLRPEEVRILYRDPNGFTQTIRAADIAGVTELITDGAALGDLWLEGYFGAGDPLVRAGAPLALREARWRALDLDRPNGNAGESRLPRSIGRRAVNGSGPAGAPSEDR